MSHAEFIDLCKQLRALGAVKVAHEGFSAEFVPVTAALVTQSQQRQPEPRMLTPEQAKEEERRRELGL